MATPAISAVSVRKLMKNDATRLASAEPRPSRSRTRSNTGRPDDGGDAPGHLGVHDDADDADDDDPRQVHAEAGAGLGVGDEVADVDEAADGGEDAEEDRRGSSSPVLAR